MSKEEEGIDIGLGPNYSKKPRRNAAVTSQETSIRHSAESKMTRMKSLFKTGNFFDWPSLAKAADVEVPEVFSSQPLNYLTLTQFALVYTTTAVDRWRESLKATTPALEVAIEHVKVDTAEVTLTCQQKKAVDEIVAKMLRGEPLVDAMLLPLKPGKGKSYVIAAVIKYLQDNNWFGLADGKFFPKGIVHLLTPKTVVEKTRRTMAELFKIKNIGTDVRILTLGEYNTKLYKPFFAEYDDVLFGNTVTYAKWTMPGTEPLFVFPDECHFFKKDKSKKSIKLRAFIGKARMIFASATAGGTVQDMKLFSLASGIKVGGERLTEHNWPAWARQFTLGHDPSEFNAAAVKRWADAMDFYICNPPDDPQKVKCRNHIKMLEFRTERERHYYAEAEERYIKAQEAVGKDPRSMELKRAMFTIFRHDEEILKVPYMGELMLKDHAEGFAPVAALYFQDAVRDMVLYLTERGIARDNIALVWGGAKEIKESDIFSQDELTKILGQIAFAASRGEKPDFDKATWAKFRKSISYTNDMVRRHETEDEKREREAKLSKLNLHAQTITDRQRNIDEFQKGQRQFCIYSFSAGGVGIDLDHQNKLARQRRLYSTICYYAEEIVQALRRTLRVATLTDVDQFICFFKGTLAAYHVAPRLTTKLKSMGNISGAAFDLVSDMEDSIAKGTADTFQIDENEGIEDEDAENAEIIEDDEEEKE